MQNWDFFGTKLGLWSHLGPSPELGTSLGESAKKNIKKLTNVSLYVCMSAENSKMLVFLCFFPNSSNLSTISMVA